MTKMGILEVQGFQFHYKYDQGDYVIYDSPSPITGFAPSVKEFEAKAIATLTEQIAQEPYVFERGVVFH